jgi:hypothetical protein
MISLKAQVTKMAQLQDEMSALKGQVPPGAAKTAKLVQKGYVERTSRTFGMWDYKSCANPLDVNSRMSKNDSHKLYTQLFIPAVVWGR